MYDCSHMTLGLSTYTVTLYKKFSGSMDSGLILQLVAHQLKSFRSADLIILKELIAKTTQIQPQANLTDDQVASMGGGTAIPCAQCKWDNWVEPHQNPSYESINQGPAKWELATLELMHAMRVVNVEDELWVAQETSKLESRRTKSFLWKITEGCTGAGPQSNNRF